jgi:TolB-like protein
VVIGVAATVGILLRRPGTQPASAAAGAITINTASASRMVRTIAVLPLVNPDPRTEHVSDGIAQHLIDGLSTSSALRVTAPTSSFRYKNTSATATSVGRELGVSVLLTGRLLEKEGQNHLRVEMIDTRDGTQLWSAEYAHPAADVVGLERRMLSDASLRLGITRADGTPQTRSPEAYDLYLRGRFLWTLRYRDNLARAVELLEQAVRIDPSFAEAWAALGMAYGTMSGGHYFPGSEAELQRKSGAAIDAALALDPALAEAWTSRAAGKFAYYWDFEGAERDFKRAIELNPSYAQAHSWYSEFLVATGRLEKARRHADLGQQLDPFSLSANSYACWARFFARDYEAAAEFVRRTRAADPTSKFSNCAPWTWIMMGDYAGAIHEMRAVNPGHADALAAALRERGTDAYWRMRLDQTVQHYPRAINCAFLGDRDAAFEELNDSFAERESALILMYVDPRFDPLRSDPRFDALARKIGLPQLKGPVSTQ